VRLCGVLRQLPPILAQIVSEMLLLDPAARPSISEILEHESLASVFPAYFLDLYNYVLNFNALWSIDQQLAYTIDQLPLLLQLPEDGLLMALPYIKQFFTLQETRLTAITSLFEPLAKALGCHAKEHLLTILLSLYEVCMVYATMSNTTEATLD
jgi:hypothetical protein